MKYMQFAIMAVLIFGIAASPVFSNGFAFATDHVECTAVHSDSLKECTNESKESNKVKQHVSDQRRANPTGTPQ